MTVSLTIFKNKYYVDTSKRMDFKDFTEFENLLYVLSQERKVKKEDASLISPATYVPGTKRANANVVDWGGWACLDVDAWTPEGDLKDAVFNRFSSYRFVCYSTASSTHDHPKFRVVFPLTCRLVSEKIKPFWFALNEMGGLLGDKQVKDLSRMYYVPASYVTSRDSNQFIFSNTGGPSIDPTVLIDKYPSPVKESTSLFDRLSPEVQEKILAHRKEQMVNTAISWTGIHDCPFWPRKMAAEYMLITGTGWYHKMYQMMIAIASRAIDKKYPITAQEIAKLCRQFDMENGGWYKDRPIEKEAERALEFVYRGM